VTAPSPDRTAVQEREARPLRPPGRTPTPRRGASGRWWPLAVVAAVVWALAGTVAGRDQLVNPAGLTVLRRFGEALRSPELSADFLRLTFDAALTTGAYAVLGTALSTVLGVVGGMVLTEAWWRRPQRAGRRRRPAVGWYGVRLLTTLPRGAHEGLWGVALVLVLGLDPLVAVLAIGLPYGAVTAKVVADLLDEHAGPAHEALRTSGAGRVAALLYGTLPAAAPDIVSYGFYRLECAVRGAVILGIVGAGGLGYQLALSFQSLRYEEMWTLIGALALLSGVADAWSARLRLHPGTGLVRRSLLAGAVLVTASWWFLRIDVTTLVDPRAGRLLVELWGDALPPRAGPGGLGALSAAAVETLQMSLAGTALAAVGGGTIAFVAARGPGGRRRPWALPCRVLLLVCRAVPTPVWALLWLFVLLPGPLPGALALAVANFGILGRLMAEVVEDLDPRPGAALRRAGAPAATVVAYATVPQALPRFAAYALYRWEVATRETVVVGLVGAGGLGRLLAEQLAAFDHAGVAGTVGVLVGLTVLVDLISGAARRALR
jgi:phosphonate transport system permease protein